MDVEGVGRGRLEHRYTLPLSVRVCVSRGIASGQAERRLCTSRAKVERFNGRLKCSLIEKKCSEIRKVASIFYLI